MKCENCKVVDIPEAQFCCSGHMCGCLGLPIDPPYCDDCLDLKTKNKQETGDPNYFDFKD